MKHLDLISVAILIGLLVILAAGAQIFRWEAYTWISVAIVWNVIAWSRGRALETLFDTRRGTDGR